MNVASLELCKELFELSGWELSSIYSKFHLERDSRGEQVPAYELDYLFRKLPTHHNFGAPYVAQTNNGKDYMASFMNWWALWEYDGKGSSTKWHNEIIDRGFHKLADTPEDAACSLAIELFKQGTLKREGGKK